MDPNSAQPIQTQPANPVPAPTFVPSPTTQPQAPKSRKWLKIVLLLIFLVLLGIGGYFGYKYYFAQNQTYNAGVYKEPQTAAKATPTPSGYQANPNDTSNQAIDADTSQIDKSMTNLNSDLNNVDQSVNDQQTNLQ